MAQFVLSYPFRFDPTARGFAHVSDDTDTYKAQQIAAYIRTGKGERPILSDFGIDDPLFHEFDSGEFYDGFSDYYPSDVIGIDDVEIAEESGRVTDIAVSFQ